MKNIDKQCIFLLMIFMIIAGCSKQISPILSDPHPYDAPLPSFSTPVTPEEVRLAFYKYSLPAIVKKLMENDKANWRMILDKVAKGDKDWIYHAEVYIKPGTDAEAKQELNIALAYALQTNPRAIMRLDGLNTKSIADICSWPFPNPTYDFARNYHKKTLAALRKLESAYEKDSPANLCIRRVERGFDAVKKEQQKGQLR